MFNKTYTASALIVMNLFMAGSAQANTETMTASWYGEGKDCIGCPVYYTKDGKPYHLLANGKVFDDTDPTIVAHRTLPKGTKLRVTYENESIILVVQDRGPFDEENGVYTRDLDLSVAAAKKLGVIDIGEFELEVEILD